MWTEHSFAVPETPATQPEKLSEGRLTNIYDARGSNQMDEGVPQEGMPSKEVTSKERPDIFHNSESTRDEGFEVDVNSERSMLTHQC